MREPLRSNQATLAATLELDGRLAGLVQRDTNLSRAISERIDSTLADLLHVLGIPGTAATRLVLDGDPSRGPRLRLQLDGVTCRYSDDSMRRVYEAVSGRRLKADVAGAALLDELLEDHGQAGGQCIVEYFGMLCRAIVAQEPSVMLGSEQVAAYQRALDELGAPGTPLGAARTAEQLAVILGRVLDLRISVGDRARVAECLARGIADGHSDEALIEDLVVALRPDAIEIRLPAAYLREMTLVSAQEDQRVFTMLRDGLFYELGVRYPSFRFVTDDAIKPGCFALRINHLEALPWRGLDRESVLVNDTPERLSLLGIRGTPAVNPANGNPCAVIAREAAERSRSAGLTTWTPLGYLVLAMAQDLRAAAPAFVDRDTVQADLESLEAAFPELIDYARREWPLVRVVQVLRALTLEGLSIRNLRLILEAMADCDDITVDSAKYIVFDERVPTSDRKDRAWLDGAATVTEFVRMRSRSYVSHKYTRGGNTLVAYLIDPAMERTLLSYRRSNQSPPESVSDAVLRAVAAEAKVPAFSTSTPVILTTVEVRPLLRQIIAKTYERVAVLSYQELEPSMNIQPIGRLSLES